MLKFTFFISILLLASHLSFSQQKDSTLNLGNRWTNHLHLSASFAKQNYVSEIAFFRNYAFGKSQKFKIGAGLRLNSYWGRNEKQFTSAPANLAKKQALEDTLQISNPSINSLNISILASYQLIPKLSLCFNIDLFGLSFGAKQNGIFYSSDLLGGKVEVESSPTSFNLLLVDIYDIGSLNSQFLIQYQIQPKLGFKLGFSHYFSEYKTTEIFTQNNDRFRQIFNMAVFGIVKTF